MSIHINDIKFALDHGHIATIEQAFRALVGWPNEESIEGANARERALLLAPVCKALKNDDRQMPGDVIAVFEDASADLYGGSYRNGAGAVLADYQYWCKRVGGGD